MGVNDGQRILLSTVWSFEMVVIISLKIFRMLPLDKLKLVIEREENYIFPIIYGVLQA